MSVSITVAGSINLDIVASGGRLPGPGETVTAQTLDLIPGGKGANQALAARRLGADVAMIGAVGRDDHADPALSLLKEGGVNLDRVKLLDDTPTGVALIAVSDEAENQITIVPGANAHVEHNDVQHLPGDALLCQLEIPVSIVEAAMSGFDGLKVLNLAPVQPVPDSLLQQADILIVNEHEFAEIGADRLKQAGGRLVVTKGAEGADLYRDGVLTQSVKAPTVTPVDTTGAGDTFCAALTVALLKGLGDEHAMGFACAAGAAATLKPGAQTSLPDQAAVEILMRV